MIRSLSVALPIVLLASACGGDVEPRLAKAVGEHGVKDVKIGEEKVTATCAMGDTIELPTAELELGLLGAKPQKLKDFGQKLVTGCSEKDDEKKRAEARTQRLKAKATELNIKTDGLSDDALKLQICAGLTNKLPVKEPERTVEARNNTSAFGCAEPPPASELPTGLWQFSATDPKKKPATQFLKLETESAKLTLRCQGGKPEMYIQADKLSAKKGTKEIAVTVDGKAGKWKAKLSKKGDAVFFADYKAAAKGLAGAGKLAVEIPTAKKATRFEFPSKGFGEAVKQMPKGCQG